jgi:hypothetical protein
MQRILVCLLLLGLVSIPLAAQDKVEIFGGYQYLHIGGQGGASGQGFNGWNAAAAFNVSKDFGLEGDFSGTYATISGVSTHVYTYGGGPIIYIGTGKVRPFAHVLFGGLKLSGSESGVSVSFNGYTIAAGGGVDAKVSKVLAIRVAQVDWVHYNLGSQTVAGVTIPSTSQSNNVRISTGVVVRF